ncbi:MAG: T9SS type A sorting domain-containing protein [Saprospiraceae bacterium]|nr:T9SS type A sorting domain-containing protein [Saprospiraceae bacterium]
MKHFTRLVGSFFILPLLFTLVVGQLAQAQICSWQSTQSNITGVTPVPAPNGSFVDYLTIDINLDINCQGIFQFSFASSAFGNACNFIEYYDQNGVLVGQENTSSANSSTFLFNNTHLDGQSTTRAKKYFFICAKANPSDPCTEYRAIFINSVTDKVGPTFVNFPSNRDLFCSSSFLPSSTTGNIIPNVDVKDNCGQVSRVTHTDFDDPALKGQAYLGGRICFVKKRTWMATDNRNNMSQRVQNLTIYDNSAPGFVTVSFNGVSIVPSEVTASTTGGFSADRVFAYAAATVSCDNTTAAFDAFRPAATDNCGLVGSLATEITPTGGELVGRSTNPTLPSFYNYFIRRTWQVFDQCGFTSVAYRDYEVKDLQSPTIAPIAAFQGTNAPILTANTGTAKTYFIAEDVFLSGCTPILKLTPTLSDNCAATEFLVATFRVEVLNSTTNSFQFVTDGNYNPFAGIVLQSERSYRVTITYRDPAGNNTQLVANVKTTAPSINILCNPLPVQKPINSTGTTTISYLEFVDQTIIVSALSNLCPTTTGLTFRMKRTTDAVWQESSGVATIVNGLPNILNVSFPELTFSCGDVGKLIDVEGQIRDATTGQVIASCTRQVQILPSQDGTINVVRFVTPATSANASDGQIALNISTVPLLSQNFNIVWTGPVSGSANGVLPNYSITNLPSGTYTITITGTATCASTVITETVTSSVPLQLGYVCPVGVAPGGVVTVQLRAIDGFEGINSLRFSITVSGVADAVISSIVALNSFPTVTSGDFVQVGAQRIDFNWTRTTGINLPDGETFLSFNVSVPATASIGSNLVVQVGGGPNNIFQATQSLGNGSNRTITPQIGTICAIPVGTVPTGNLTAGGFVTFMSTGKPLSAVNINGTDDGTNLTPSTTNSTGAYNFTNISSGSSIQLRASFTGLANAFQLNDIVLLKRYLSGALPSEIGITSGYQLIAGDVNNDNRIELRDAVQMERGLIGFLPSENGFDVNSWVFVLGSQTVPVSANIPTLTTMFSTTLTSSVTNANFVGIKKGDVNQSASVSPSGQTIENRALSSLTSNDQMLEAGNTYFLAIKASEVQAIAGLQMEFQYKEYDVAIEEIITNSAFSSRGDFLHKFDNGQLRLLWTDAKGVAIKINEPLVTLKLKALTSGKYLSQVIGLNNQEDVNTIYTDDLQAKNLSLQFVDDSANNTFELGVSPNPTKEKTVIQFNLPVSGEVALTLVDLSGKVVFRQTQYLERGHNQLLLERGRELPTTGVFFYVLATTNHQASGKIVVID